MSRAAQTQPVSQRKKRRAVAPVVPVPVATPEAEQRESRQLDNTIELFLDFLAQRRGRDRNNAFASQIAKRFHTTEDVVKRVMQAAWARNLVLVYPSDNDVYYVRRMEL